MAKIYCETCKEEITNPRFILDELTSIGYERKNFCQNKMCFIKYVVKKFRGRIKKVLGGRK